MKEALVVIDMQVRFLAPVFSEGAAQIPGKRRGAPADGPSIPPTHTPTRRTISSYPAGP